MTSTQAVEARINEWAAYAEARGLVVKTHEDTNTVEFSATGDTYDTKIWVHTFGGKVSVVRYYPHSSHRVPVAQKTVKFNINMLAGRI